MTAQVFAVVDNVPRMWRDFFLDHTFWSTVAIASTALLVAVVLEVRPTREDRERGKPRDRVTNLLTALWGLAVALVGSLIISSITTFPGDVVAGLASVVTLVAAAYGLWGLLWAITARILRS